MIYSIKAITSFPKALDFSFSLNSSYIFLKGFCGVLGLSLPSKFFVKNSTDVVSFIFNNSFFYKSFVRHLLTFSIICLLFILLR